MGTGRYKRYVCNKCGEYSEHVNEHFECYRMFDIQKTNGYERTQCDGEMKPIEDVNYMHSSSMLDAIQESAQKIFDEQFKPQMVKEMKRLKIKRIESSMGVTFFTFNNGKCLSDFDFFESSSARNAFYNRFIQPLGKTPLYQLIDFQIKL